MIPPHRAPPAHFRVRSAFGPPAERRALRLILDDDTLTREDVHALVAIGAADTGVELIRTAQGARPRLEIQEPRDDHVPIHELGGSSTVRLFWVPHADRLREDARALAERVAIQESMAWRAVVFAAAGSERESDGLITRRRGLEGARALALLEPSEALALIGLSRRRRGELGLGEDLGGLRLEGATFHFVHARELLREGWRWFSGCVASSTKTGDWTVTSLGQTAIERIVRVLQIRDHLQAGVRTPGTLHDDLVFWFEAFLLFASAAFDATARVAHLVYLGRRYADAGWRRPAWRSNLAAVAPQLAAQVDDGTAATAVLQLVSRLRNTIHGEGFQSMTLQHGGHARVQRIELADEEAAALRRRVAVLGDHPSAWGIERHAGTFFLAPDRYAEALLPHMLRVINRQMAATDVSQLPGVSRTDLLEPPANVPSNDPLNELFSYEIRSRVRQLGGVG